MHVLRSLTHLVTPIPPNTSLTVKYICSLATAAAVKLKLITKCK